MQVIVTMAGRGQRFSEKGFLEPKPMVLAGGRPVFSYLIDSFSKNWSLIFVLAEHDRSSSLESSLKKYAELAGASLQVIYTAFSERGPMDTVQAAIPFLRAGEPVLVSYCDLAPIWNPSDFEKIVLNRAANCDLASVNYQGFHPTYFGPNSYCHVQVDAKTQLISGLQEKVLFTDQIEKEITSAGIYFFKDKELLQLALSAQIEQNLQYKNEFYISLALQALLNKDKSLRVLDYRVAQVVQFGTPADIERFEFWLQYFTRARDNFATGEKQKKLLYIEASKTPISLGPKIFETEKSYWKKVFAYFKLISS